MSRFSKRLVSVDSFSTSSRPSYVTLPAGSAAVTVYEFLLSRFPHIPKSVWLERIKRNRVHFDDGEPIDSLTPYQAHRSVYYYREVINEVHIPFREEVLFENDNFLVADKPCFLPVHPAGQYVNETLISRLREKYGHEELGSAHRIDRLTSGLVLCVKNRSKRGLYQQMFQDGTVKKIYLAAGKIPEETDQTHWHVKVRMEPVANSFRMRIVPNGPVNSESSIDLIECCGGIGLFRLRPITGRKHQLRVHLCSIGSGILNDPLYPDDSMFSAVDDYQRPMQLLAHRLEFIDPVTGKHMEFESRMGVCGANSLHMTTAFCHLSR